MEPQARLGSSLPENPQGDSSAVAALGTAQGGGDRPPEVGGGATGWPKVVAARGRGRRPTSAWAQSRRQQAVGAAAAALRAAQGDGGRLPEVEEMPQGWPGVAATRGEGRTVSFAWARPSWAQDAAAAVAMPRGDGGRRGGLPGHRGDTGMVQGDDCSLRSVRNPRGRKIEGEG
ncbi:DNA-binding protein EMBP-1-like [Ananas comosus]|uniref:DNA-binding protein EMBP-1-like n=1 Tax=Ananas comosus TaxID=4615 RepID=A0A6P5GRZ0_ANACO|nr:DNA-binding protein EMBP-1-like [Ananas comosus]